MDMFKAYDSLQRAYICVPTGLHSMPTR